MKLLKWLFDRFPFEQIVVADSYEDAIEKCGHKIGFNRVERIEVRFESPGYYSVRIKQLQPITDGDLLKGINICQK